jgi:hypothetical protein
MLQSVFLRSVLRLSFDARMFEEARGERSEDPTPNESSVVLRSHRGLSQKASTLLI